MAEQGTIKVGDKVIFEKQVAARGGADKAGVTKEEVDQIAYGSWERDSRWRERLDSYVGQECEVVMISPFPEGHPLGDPIKVKFFGGATRWLWESEVEKVGEMG